MYWVRLEPHRKDDSRDKFFNDPRSNRINFINRDVYKRQVSTLLAPILTPLFVVLYAGATSSIEIQFMPMFISIVKIVLVPIILGIVLNYFIGAKIEPVKSVCPTIAAIAVLLLSLIHI